MDGVGGEEMRDLMLSIYRFLDVDDADVVRCRLDELVGVSVSLFHSFVDNDKPVKPVDRLDELSGVVVGGLLR